MREGERLIVFLFFQCIFGLLGPWPEAPGVPDAPVASSMMLWVGRRERTCGVWASAGDGDDDVDSPGTLEDLRDGGVLEVWLVVLLFLLVYLWAVRTFNKYAGGSKSTSKVSVSACIHPDPARTQV